MLSGIDSQTAKAGNPYRHILRRRVPEPVLALLLFVMGVWLWDNHFGEEQGYEEGACRMALIKIDRDLRLAEGMERLPVFVRVALLIDSVPETINSSIRSLVVLGKEKALDQEGAYALAILTADHDWNFWPAFLAAALVSAAVGALVGIVSLRLKEHFFAIFTLCVGFIIYLLIDKWEALTHGAIGIRGIAAPDGFGLVDFSQTVPFYYLALLFLVLAIWFAGRLASSLLGRTFMAIRNGDALAQSLGIDLMRNKLLAFVLSTTYAGVAGALYASMIRFIGPEEANPNHTFDMITYLLVGGFGTLFGPLAGTVGVVWITQSLQFLEDYRMIIFGPLIVVLVIFMPRGVIGTFLGWKLRKDTAAARANDPRAATKVAPGNEVNNNA